MTQEPYDWLGSRRKFCKKIVIFFGGWEKFLIFAFRKTDAAGSAKLKKEEK